MQIFFDHIHRECSPFTVLLTRETTLFNGFGLTFVACASSNNVKFKLKHLIRMGSWLTLKNKPFKRRNKFINLKKNRKAQ